MTQEQAVVETVKKLGGIATLGQLYQNIFLIEDCKWNTKTPHASIRRIVQLSSYLYKIKPGLYALKEMQTELETKGIVQETEKNRNSEKVQVFNHTYYQGLLLSIGNMRGYGTFSPNQDKNKRFSNQTLGELRNMQKVPAFSYPHLVKRCETIDAIWFNERNMPSKFFEVEHSTDIYNSLLKYTDLQDFYTGMYIVASEERRKEFHSKIHISAFLNLEKDKRVIFLSYADLEKLYLSELQKMEVQVSL